MTKIVLLLVVAAFAASPAAAATKHKKAKLTAEQAQMAKQDADIAIQHENTLHLLRDAAPLVLPTGLLPVYFSMQQDDKKKK